MLLLRSTQDSHLGSLQWSHSEDITLSLGWSCGMETAFWQGECQQSGPTLLWWHTCGNDVCATWGAWVGMPLVSSFSLIVLPRQKISFPGEVEEWHLQEQEVRVRVTWSLHGWAGNVQHVFSDVVGKNEVSSGWPHAPRKFTVNIPASWNTLSVMPLAF